MCFLNKIYMIFHDTTVMEWKRQNLLNKQDSEHYIRMTIRYI